MTRTNWYAIDDFDFDSYHLSNDELLNLSTDPEIYAWVNPDYVEFYRIPKGKMWHYFDAETVALVPYDQFAEIEDYFIRFWGEPDVYQRLNKSMMYMPSDLFLSNQTHYNWYLSGESTIKKERVEFLRLCDHAMYITQEAFLLDKEYADESN